MQQIISMMFWLLTVLILLGGAACQDAVGISGNHVGELISLILFNLLTTLQKLRA